MLDRRAIINGRMLLALWLNEEPPKLSDRARDLCDVSPYRVHNRRRSYGPYTELFDALDGCELADVVAFFLMLDARTNPTRPRNLRDANLADDYARAHDPGGVKIHIKNSDDDPCHLDLDVTDRIANAWADRHSSPVGGTWEPVDGEDFVYDSTIWHPKLVEELEASGYNLDLSNYADPDEDEIAASEHACSGCSLCGDSYEKALAHVREEEPLVQTAHEQIGGVEDDYTTGASDALDATIRGTEPSDDTHHRGAHP